MNDVFLDWHAGDRFGWGIVGLNLFLQWANDATVRPLMGQPIDRAVVGPCDPLRLAGAADAIERSNRFLAGLQAGDRRPLDATVVAALGNGFETTGLERRGTSNIGRCIFEDTALTGARQALARHDELLVASTWNARLLEQATGRSAKVVFEGVDPSLFCPAPRSGMDGDRFHVFSGGKVEYRKGQDLVLMAFARFARTRKDAVLVTAWQSIWPHRSVGFRGRLAAPVELAAPGRLDIRRWAQRNGIDPDAVVDLGLVPNAFLPTILREMDVALQPSRAEACTNLPVKEAMACGVPVIAALNTGMHDLLNDDNAIVLKKQTTIGGPQGASTVGWGESDVDEIVAALEFAYDHRAAARAIGLKSRQWLLDHGRTWRDHAAELKGWILSQTGRPGTPR